MNLREVLNGISYHVIFGNLNRSVNSLCSNSKNVRQGDALFLLSDCCYTDSRYVREACAGAVSAVIMEQGKCDTILFSQIFYLCKRSHTTLVTMTGLEAGYAHAASVYYHYPEHELKLIGITGTKGKTTTAHFLYQILKENGISCGTIGTCGAYFGQHHLTLTNTTPDAMTLHGLFRKMSDEGCRVVVMEVSSQALKKGRTLGLEFEYGIFTNISQDHISKTEHGSMEEYIACKALLFQQCRNAFFNLDDTYSVEMMQKLNIPVRTYSVSQKADLYITDMQQGYSDEGMVTLFRTKGMVSEDFRLHVPGIFNISNALPAIGVALELHIVQEGIKRTLSQVTVPGRMECYPLKNGALAVIDYAHNADSLDKLLSSLREYHPVRIICVFGCGGNRAVSRRIQMGKISACRSDLTIITSDNPRGEEPIRIMQDIETGVKEENGSYLMIEDRRKAVYYALNISMAGDMIVIAGKGHEDYQEVNGIRYPLADRKMIEDYYEQEIREHHSGDLNRETGSTISI